MCGVIAAVILALFGGIGYFTLVPPLGAESEAIFEQFKDDADEHYPVSSMNALTGGTMVFEPDLWTMETGSSEFRTTYTWLSDEYGAVAYFEYLVFASGLPLARIDDTFNADWISQTLSPYAPITEQDRCQMADVRLYEYRGTIQSTKTDYDIRYWVDPVNPNYIVAVFMAFPVSDEGVALDNYAARIYPDISACSEKVSK